MKTRELPPAVALVPGFFGFSHSDEFTYFADRFVAGLRSTLEARGVTGVPVLSVSTLGIGSLHERQAELLRELRALENGTKDMPGLGGPRAWHLIGHSTGGVDAALLLKEEPLAKGPNGSTYAAVQTGWGEWADLVERVQSVITLAAPHFGTGLAESPVARFAAGHPSLTAVRDIALAALDMVRRGDLRSRLQFALSATPKLMQMPKFMLHMALSNQLARDLQPHVLQALSSAPMRAECNESVYSIATVSPRPTAEHPDKLFRDMWRWTHDGIKPDRSPSDSVATYRARAETAELADLALRLPTQRHLSLPEIDEGDNDGIVTTHHQVFGELIGVVVGDHVDVLGRYRRISLVDGKVIDPGLLTSGADFGDDEFFALLLRIGDKLAQLIRA